MSLAGNAFLVREGDTIKRLRPDFMAIALTGDEDDPDVEVLGYVYFPGGPHSGNDPVPYLREQVAHYAPIPDPLAKYRGMSWLTPVIREIMADSGFRDHKIDFLEKGGTVNFLFQIAKESMTEDQFNSFVQQYRGRYEQPGGANKSIFMRAAVDATQLGSTFVDMQLKEVTGAGETRIAAAAGVPPIVAGLSEGLKSATYSNYGQARRRFADGTMRPLWRNAAASLQTLVPAPTGFGTVVRRPRHPRATGGPEGTRRSARVGSKVDAATAGRRFRARFGRGRDQFRGLEAANAHREAFGAVAGAGAKREGGDRQPT